MFKKTLAAGAAVAASLIGITAPASAAGAYVVNYSGCTDYGYAVVCTTIQAEYNSVSTPSGTFVDEGNGTYSSTVTSAFGTTTDSGSFHDQGVTSGQSEEAHGAFTDVLSVPYYGTCTTTIFVHEVNGTIQFDYQTFTCTQP